MPSAIRWYLGGATIVALLAACAQGEKPTSSLELAVQGIYAGDLSPTGDYALVGSLNHGASLWRLTDRERLYDWRHKADEHVELVAAAIAFDGSRAVTTDPRTMVVWDMATGESIEFWGTPGAVRDTAMLPGGDQVLLGLEDHSAIVVDIVTGRHGFTLLHEGMVNSVAISNDGQRAVTGSEDHQTIIWDLATGSAIHRLDLGNPVNEVAMAPDGTTVFAAAEHALVGLWDADTGKVVHIFSSDNDGVTSAAFSKDGRHILVGYIYSKVELWDAITGNRIKRWSVDAKNPWRPTGAAILDLSFASRPSEVLALTGDGRVHSLNI